MDQNFEIVILFSIVENDNNYVFGIKTKRKPFSQTKNQYANFILIIYVWRAKIKHALIQKRSEIKWKKLVF